MTINFATVSKTLGRQNVDARIVTADALAWVSAAGAELTDLVFVDPPFDLIGEVAPILFARLGEVLAPRPDALVAFETPGEITLEPSGWTCLKRLGKGARQPTVGFFRRVRDSR